MITYNLTRDKMLEYLDQAITKTTTELTQVQQESPQAQLNFKAALDSLLSMLRFELYDPEASTIALLTTKAMKKFKERAGFSLFRKFYALVGDSRYISCIYEYVSFTDTENFIQNVIDKSVSKAVTQISDSLLATDNDCYNFNIGPGTPFYSLAELNPKLRELYDECKAADRKVNNLLDQQQNLTCRLSELQKEYTLTEFSSSVTFQLTSECKL